MATSLLFTSSCIRIYFSPSGNLLISTFPGFWPSSFATFSARLVDAEPASIIIGETEARGWDLIKAELNEAKVLGFAGSDNALVKCHLQRLILVTSRLSKQSPSMSLQGTRIFEEVGRGSQSRGSPADRYSNPRQSHRRRLSSALRDRFDGTNR